MSVVDNELKLSILEWVKSAAKERDEIKANNITMDTPILEARLITSLQVMDLIMYLEHLLGSPIDVNKIKPGAFASVDAICDSFLGGGNAQRRV